jgi:hypothetical protein
MEFLVLGPARQTVTAAVDHVLQPLELTWWAFREFLAMTAPARQAVRDLASLLGVEEAHLLVVGHRGRPLEGWLRSECPDFHLANAHIHPPPRRPPLERPATPTVHDLAAWRPFVAHLLSLPRSAMSSRALQKFWRLREAGGPCFLLISTFPGSEGLEMGMPERPGVLLEYFRLGDSTASSH